MKFKATLCDRGPRVLEKGFLPTLEKYLATVKPGAAGASSSGAEASSSTAVPSMLSSARPSQPPPDGR